MRIEQEKTKAKGRGDDAFQKGSRWASWLQTSAWAPLAMKGAGYGAAALLLFAVGSGAIQKVLGFEPSEAAAANSGSAAAEAQPSATASASAAPVRTGVLVEADAGVPPAEPKSEPAKAAGGITADGKVVLNVASEEELRRLPGVGPAKAAAIVELRAKLKKFRKVEDLLRIKGIGRRKLAKLRPLVVLDPPEMQAP